MPESVSTEPKARRKVSLDSVIYEVAYGIGYQVGWAHGWAARDDELQALFGLYRSALSQPRRSELEKARQPTDEPCSLRCRRCSRCIRALAVRRRLAAGLPADYAGAGICVV
jgi:hypothetical protein